MSDERVKKILLITFGVLIGLLVLINIVRYVNTLPSSEITIYPTTVPESQSQHESAFPTQNPEQVSAELERILNDRAVPSETEKASIASLSAELVLHPYRGTDFEIIYSPILNLFFLKMRGNTDDALIVDYLKDPVLRKMYRENGYYRLFVISRASAEYSRYAYERQYNEVRSKLPPDKRL